MIDIHAHILPGLDDGAQSVEDSVQMARMASENGIRRMVATPHVQWINGDENQKILDTVKKVRLALAQEGIDLAVVPGAELFLDPVVNAQLRLGSALTINGGRYVLVELPMLDYPAYADQTIFDLQIRGFTPILAHPERVGAFLRDIKILFRLVERGVMTQITAESLLGGFGNEIKGLTETMLAHKLAHVIASDAHSVDHRPPLLRAAVERAAQIVGNERAWAMVTAVPQAIVDNQPVDLPEPKAYQAPKLWNRWKRRSNEGTNT